MRQDTERQPIPQADGDGRRFNTHGLGSHVRVHVEKRGPAFSDLVAQDANETELLPVKVAEQSGASLVAQTTAAIGDVLSAINRGVLLDLLPAWQRLLKVQMLSIPVPPSDTVTIRHRWAYADLRDAVDAAMGTGVGPWAWVRPDMMIRQMAREQAERSHETLMGLTREWLTSEVGTQARETLRHGMVAVTNQIAAFQAFAEGQ